MKIKQVFILFVVCMITIHSFSQQSNNQDAFKGIIKFEEYENLISKKDNTLYVVNFWASWCAPCVEELPDFMEINQQFRHRKDFKMVLISLDNQSDLESTVRPFLKEHNISSDVYLLDDIKRMNYWMPKVDRNWKGSIPATVFYKNGKKLQFIEKQLHQKELLETINQFISL